jgi:hypothetical protein
MSGRARASAGWLVVDRRVSPAAFVARNISPLMSAIVRAGRASRQYVNGLTPPQCGNNRASSIFADPRMRRARTRARAMMLRRGARSASSSDRSNRLGSSSETRTRVVRIIRVPISRSNPALDCGPKPGYKLRDEQTDGSDGLSEVESNSNVSTLSQRSSGTTVRFVSRLKRVNVELSYSLASRSSCDVSPHLFTGNCGRTSTRRGAQD